MSDLQIKDIHKDYKGVTVLKGIDLHVDEGELVSLLGPSGCGKSTTLNIVAGFMSPSSGAVLIGGKDVTHEPPYRRDSSIVFQNYALFPHKSVFENVAFGLRKRGYRKAELSKRVEEVLGLVGIEPLSNRFPAQLSGGQQQRVAVARAIAVRPGILLLDEPLSNIDHKMRLEVRIQLRRLQQSLGQTALFVTHDQDEAIEMSDRIAVMRDGRIEQLGTPPEIFESPATTYVADFVGFENLLPVEDFGAEFSDFTQQNGARKIAVRAGSMNVVPTGHEKPGTITTTARIAQSTYRGESQRLELAGLKTGIPLVAEVGSEQRNLLQGDSVTISVDSTKVVRLP